MDRPRQDVTSLLENVSAGNHEAWNKLLAIVYRELHGRAHKEMSRERSNHTLQTTALVHEAYIRLVEDREGKWENRAHFFSVAANAMRRILVEKARSRNAAKRGKGKHPLSLDLAGGDSPGSIDGANLFEDLEALDRALNKLGARKEHQRKCTVVELRYFVGLTHEQTADVLGLSMATVVRDWEFARAWLCSELEETR